MRPPYRFPRVLAGALGLFLLLAGTVDAADQHARATLLRELEGKIYLGLAEGARGALERLEPDPRRKPTVAARTELSRAPIALVALGDLLYVGLSGTPGRLLVLDPQTLATRGAATLPAGKEITGLAPWGNVLMLTTSGIEGPEVGQVSLQEPLVPQYLRLGPGRPMAPRRLVVPRAITDRVPAEAVVDWLRDPTLPDRLLVAARAGEPLRVLDGALDELRIQDRNGDGILRLACVGDSNTRESTVADPADFCTVLQKSVVHPAFEIVNTSRMGAGIRSPAEEKRGQTLVEAALAQNPDALILALGTNDLPWFDPRGVSAASRDRVKKAKSFEAQVEAHGADFFIALVPPRFDGVGPEGSIAAFNREILGAWPPSQVIDFHNGFVRDDYVADGLHFHGRGNAKRGRRAYQFLLEPRELRSIYREDPAPRAAPEATAEKIHFVRVEIATIAEALGLPTSVAVDLERCSGIRAMLSTCDPALVAGCHAALERAFEATAAVRDAALSTTAGAPRGAIAATASRLLTETGEALHLLAAWRDAFGTGSCESLAGRATPARLRLLRDGQTLTVQPIEPLRMNRRYRLVVRNAEPDELAAARDSVWPRPEAASPFPEAIATSWPAGNESWVSRTGSFLEDLALQVTPESDRDAATVPGFRVKWPRKLGAADLSRLRFDFVPAQDDTGGETIHAFRTRDDRERFLAERDRVRARSCVPLEWAPLEDTEVPGLRRLAGRVYSARLPAIGETGLTAGAESTPIPLLLALPARLQADTPLVILVHGHAGNALRGFARHAGDLVARGLAVAALDLPDHRDGQRGERFLGTLAPRTLADHLELAALETISLIDVAARCGFSFTDRAQWLPEEFMYLGYSIGSMVGILVRGTEDRLGPTVLLAAAGDLPGWIMNHVPTALGAKPGFNMVCIGGPDDGSDCLQGPACATPGVCGRDPDIFELREQITLPLGWALAPAEPLAWARERTGGGSRAPLLMITGGADAVLHPLLATRLGDALDLGPANRGVRRGPHAARVQFPGLDHALRDDPTVRKLASDFLATGGHPSRRRVEALGAPE